VRPGPAVRLSIAAVAAAAATALAGCQALQGPASPPPITSPGSPDRPREVNVIARDYSFDPPEVQLVPGETVLLHLVNAGLDVHEAVIGDQRVQDAWEQAEAALAGAPPGPTPAVSVPPDRSGLRVVVRSGERVDTHYTVPDTGELFVGCHIPGHYARGMVVPVRLVAIESATS